MKLIVACYSLLLTLYFCKFVKQSAIIYLSTSSQACLTQGCYKASSALILLLISVLIKDIIRSFAVVVIGSNNDLLNLPLVIFSIISSSFFPLKGGLPVSKLKSITPML